MKLKVSAVLALLLSGSAFAEFPIEVEVAEVESDYIPQMNATVQVMNKQAGKTTTITIPVGSSKKFDKLDIAVKKCLSVNEFLPEDFFMFAEITRSGRKIFSGWMTRNEPGQNPLVDADNDLWLVRCE